MGIPRFLDERAEKQDFLALTLDDFKYFRQHERGLQSANTYYHHYGPHDNKNGTILVSDAFLYLFGGSKYVSGGHASSMDLLSNEVKVYEPASSSWLRMSHTMPQRLTEFGVLLMRDKYLYLVGGLTDEIMASKSNNNVVSRNVAGGGQRKLAISRDVYRLAEEDWFGSIQWRKVAELPSDRTDFTVATIDSSRFCVVGPDYCDIFNTETGEWKTVNLASKIPRGQDRPSIAVLGTLIYVISSKCKEEANNAMWTIDVSSLTKGGNSTSSSWNLLTNSLKLRFDPVCAFGHNGLLYVWAWQPATSNSLYEYDPLRQIWTLKGKQITGHFATNTTGILVKHSLIGTNLKR